MNKNTQLPLRETEKPDPEMHETEEPKPVRSGIISKKAIISAAVCLVAAAVCAVILCKIQENAFRIAGENFNSALAAERENTYDKFYNLGYDIGEKRSHISNDVLVDVNKIKEVEVLEVLDVSASDVKEYKFDNELTNPANVFLELVRFVTGEQVDAPPPEAVVWLEGSCIGTYEIDLKSSEVIIDNANKYVLVRLPSPSLRFISHDFEVKYFNNGTGTLRKVFDGSAQRGLDAAIQDTADMTAHLHDILNDRDQSDHAREQAEILVVDLIKDLNSDVPDITVDVEFFS